MTRTMRTRSFEHNSERRRGLQRLESEARGTVSACCTATTPPLPRCHPCAARRIHPRDRLPSYLHELNMQQRLEGQSRPREPPCSRRCWLKSHRAPRASPARLAFPYAPSAVRSLSRLRRDSAACGHTFAAEISGAVQRKNRNDERTTELAAMIGRGGEPLAGVVRSLRDGCSVRAPSICRSLTVWLPLYCRPPLSPLPRCLYVFFDLFRACDRFGGGSHGE